jgi:hypothetical protein
MQARLAVIGLLSAVGAWRGLVALLGGVLLGTAILFTHLVIFPTNRALEDRALEVGSPDPSELLAKWNRLHAFRSAAASLP